MLARWIIEDLRVILEFLESIHTADWLEAESRAGESRGELEVI